MRVLRWFVDTWVRFSHWYSSRRETIAVLQDELRRVRAEHARELDDLRGQLEIAERHAKFVAKINAKHVAMIEAEIALNKRLEADALRTVAPKQ